MFALALSDTQLFAVEDDDPEDWLFHYADFDPLVVDSFHHSGRGGGGRGHRQS
jgi:hypothetical protein